MLTDNTDSRARPMARHRLHTADFDTVHSALQTWTTEELKRVLKQLPTRERPTRKAALVALVAAQLSGSTLQTLWRAMSPIQQVAVAEAIHSPDDVYQPEQFSARYGSLPAMTGIVQLFLFRTSRGLIVPDDLRQRLLRFVPAPPDPELATSEEPPAYVTPAGDPAAPNGAGDASNPGIPLTRRNTELEALADLPTVLRLVAQGAVAVSATTARPTAATMRALTGRLCGGDFYQPESRQHAWQQLIGPIKAFAWPMLLQAGGLAKRNGTRLALTRTGQAALGTDPAEVLRGIWSRWLRTRLVDEFNRIDAIRGQTGKGKRGMTNVTDRRLAIEDALSDCPPNAWLTLAELSRYMRAAGHTFEVTRNPWTLYIAEARHGSLGYAGSHPWNILQERYLRCVLFEYAATLGMVDVAYIHPREARADYLELWGVDELEYLSPYDGLMFLRLTPLGAYCLQLADVYEPTGRLPVTRLAVMPDLTIRLREEPACPAAAVVLESWAVQESEACWRLDLGRAVRAVEDRRSTSELRELLQDGDDQPLPERVEGFLARAERDGQALKVNGAALLIECADSDLARRIAAHADTQALCLRAGDRHLVVRAESESAFRRAVNHLGYGLAVR